MTIGGNTVGELNVKLTADGGSLSTAVAKVKQELSSVSHVAKSVGSDIANSLRGLVSQGVGAAGGGSPISSIMGGLGSGSPLGIGVGLGLGLVGLKEMYDQNNDPTKYRELQASIGRDQLRAMRQTKEEQELNALNSSFDAQMKPLRDRRETLTKRKAFLDSLDPYGMNPSISLAEKLAVGDELGNVEAEINTAERKQSGITAEKRRQLKIDKDETLRSEKETQAERNNIIAANVKGNLADEITAHEAEKKGDIERVIRSTQIDKDRTKPGSDEYMRLQEIISGKTEELRLEGELEKALQTRLKVTTTLAQLSQDIASAGQQAGAFPLSDITFSSATAAANSSPYLFAIASALAGMP